MGVGVAQESLSSETPRSRKMRRPTMITRGWVFMQRVV
jgi:hypothetical protein